MFMGERQVLHDVDPPAEKPIWGIARNLQGFERGKLAVQKGAWRTESETEGAETMVVRLQKCGVPLSEDEGK